MTKTVRIVLYILSILTIAGVLAAFVVSGKQSSGEEETIAAEAQTAENEKKNQDTAGTHTDGENVGSVAETATENMENTKNAENAEDTESTVNIKEKDGSKSAENKSGENADSEKKSGIKNGDTTILFTGDVLFANAFQAGYDAGGIGGVISEELLGELKSADILMVNNEFPFSDRGTPMENKQFTFRCSPSYVKALSEMGVDVVSLANNHTLDYGKDALSDTFAALDGAGILYGGAGENVERAEELQVIEVNGKKFGFLAVSRVIPETSWKVENSAPGIFSCYDDTRLIELVKEAKKTCDFVAVYPHWGVEYKETPESYQTQIAKRCIEAGADVIVGSHTHCLQGVGLIQGKPVFYSLGNFIFGQQIEKSAVVKVTVKENGETSFQMLPVSAAGGVTGFAGKDAAENILRYIDSISSEAGIAADGTVIEPEP